MSEYNNTQSMMPEVTFSAFVMSLASAALVGMGLAPDPSTGVLASDMMLARHNIDILEMLRQKTCGCLDEKESKLLNNLLCDLRLKFVMQFNKTAQ